MTDDQVNHPSHYNSDPSGVECIDVVRHRNFNVGNAIKYLWRAGLKGSASEIQDLKKAAWYIADEIARLEKIEQAMEAARIRMNRTADLLEGGPGLDSARQETANSLAKAMTGGTDTWGRVYTPVLGKSWIAAKLWPEGSYVRVRLSFGVVYIPTRGGDSVYSITRQAARAKGVQGPTRLYFKGRKLEDTEIVGDLTGPGGEFELRVADDYIGGMTDDESGDV